MPITSEQRRASRLKRDYNLTTQEYDDLYRMQGGVCAICRQPERLHVTNRKTGIREPQRLSVDHSHLTGLVRGLLCDGCNTGIGKFKDDVNIIAAAIRYLQGTLSHA